MKTIDHAQLDSVTGGINWVNAGKTAVKWADRIAGGINIGGMAQSAWDAISGKGKQSK